MTLLSPLFPRSPVNVGQYLKILPPDQTVPVCLDGNGCTHQGTRRAMCPYGERETVPWSRVTQSSPLGKNPSTK